MKRLAFCWVLLATPLFLYAQQHALCVQSTPVSFDSAAKVVLQQMIAADPYDTSEGGEVNAFRRWTEFYKNRVAYDAPQDSSIHDPVFKGLTYYMQNQSAYCGSSGSYSGHWTPLGPFTNYYGPNQNEKQGRVDAVWVDPDDVNHILAGANKGGLWESTDLGQTWTNISDPTSTNGSPMPGTMGVRQIAVNPLDHDIIYIAMNMDNVENKHGGYTMGVGYTEDGGQTWNYDYDFLSANAQQALDRTDKWVKKLAYMPGTDDLWAISDNKVLVKQSQLSNWFDLTPDNTMFYTDLEFSINTPGKVIVSTRCANGTTKFWIFNTSTWVWSSFSISPPTGYYFVNDESGITDFSVNGSDSLYFFLASRQTSDNTPHKGIYRTPWTHAALQAINTTGNQFGVWQSAEFVVVSPVNSRILYATQHNGWTNYFRSTDWGQNFTHIAGNTHADARAITLYHADTDITGASDILFGGSDGGIVMKPATE